MLVRSAIRDRRPQPTLPKKGNYQMSKHTNTTESAAGAHSVDRFVRTFILQEQNDDDPHEPYWYDDDQLRGTEVSEKKCVAYVKRDMRENPRHYAANKHRIVMREETEISFPTK